ncbi:MAG: NAD(+)/NADH kinase [Planctomycetaceae bacterium]|nr:NAD(+)/NADH kinase [Planctomycetaceae bacterium]
MSAQPERVLIVIRDGGERVAQVADEIVARMSSETGLSIAGIVSTDGIDPQADFTLVVALGGDGTILRTCRQLGQHQRPIMGVNLGRLGFLAELSPEEFLHRVPEITRRGYVVARHLMFACEHRHGDGRQETHLGLNEVALLAAGSLQLLEVELAIDGETVTTFTGDGLLISTPVGSTAHSLAAGGPILRQDLEAFVVTPVCPHALTDRPLIDRADCTYRLQAPSAHPGVMLVIDGQLKTPFLAGDVAEVRRADVAFQLARLPGHSYYRTLHRKLGWAGHPRG